MTDEMPKTLVVSNLELGDIPFDNDRASWNVTRAQADCDAGKHGVFRFPVADVLANNDSVDVDDAKVARYCLMPAVLAKPLIFVVDNGALWLIEGHHRLRAMARIGVAEFTAFVIEKNVDHYRILYNGQPLPPWAKGVKP